MSDDIFYHYSSHEVDNDLKKLVCSVDKNNKCCAKNDHYKFKLCAINNSLSLEIKLKSI